jgi:hypothetical protein
VTRDRDVFSVPRREKSADKGTPSE